mmetsp:Transcript_24020/g.51906  ORF Transcript_24020/g.51906 Transcript_24020/m.51906 type:complete len:169 (-) Transcript_24020:749-1255(-)
MVVTGEELDRVKKAARFATYAESTIKMKNANPNMSSLRGRLEVSSCFTPPLQKKVPFCRNSSTANRPYTEDSFDRFFENHTESTAVTAIIPTSNNHTPMVKGSRTLLVSSAYDLLIPGLGITNTVRSYCIGMENEVLFNLSPVIHIGPMTISTNPSTTSCTAALPGAP